MTSRLPGHFWSSLFLFALPALSLCIPSGYSYAPAVLVLASLAGARSWWARPVQPAATWWLLAGFLLLALSWWVDDFLSKEGGASFDKPVKILLTVPCLLYLLQRPPQARWLWSGLVAGAAGAALLALYQVLARHPMYVHLGRVPGFTNPIQFGNLALMMGMLALCGWNAHPQAALKWRLWLLAGFLCGLVASGLSGSRGGWLALLVVGAGAGTFLLARGHFRGLVVAGILVLAGAIAAWHVPQLHLAQRLDTARQEATDFQDKGKANTSIGARLQMWQFAWSLYQQHPLQGWTQKGYVDQVRKAVEAGQLDPMLLEFTHPHNEMLDAAAKRGTLGLWVLWVIYATPFALFAAWWRRARQPGLRAVCAAGMLVPVAYLCFGLTQSFLPHNSGTMMYFYLLAGLWATAWGLQQAPAPAAG